MKNIMCIRPEAIVLHILTQTGRIMGRTNIFYDCEFLEDGTTIDLISIGMVASDGREYYAVSNEFNMARVAKDPWLMANVMSSIDHFTVGGDKDPFDLVITDPAAKSRQDIALGVRNFIVESWNPSLWANFAAYDHVCYAQLFGKMIHLPNGCPMITHDIQTLRLLSNAPRGPEQEGGNHNALADARHNKVLFDYYWSLLTK